MLNNELPTTIVLHDFESTKDSTNERQIKQRLTTSPDFKARHRTKWLLVLTVYLSESGVSIQIDLITFSHWLQNGLR